MATKKRLKNDTVLFMPIANWAEADEIVRQIGDLQLQITNLEQAAKEDLDSIKAKLAEAVKPLQEKIKLHTRSLEAFAANNRKDFGRAQSRKLNFGMLGWRKSASISIKKTTLELIRKVFGKRYAEYVHVKESVNREALRRLTDEQLASVGARRKIKEAFFVEPDLPEIVDYQ